MAKWAPQQEYQISAAKVSLIFNRAGLGLTVNSQIAKVSS